MNPPPSSKQQKRASKRRAGREPPGAEHAILGAIAAPLARWFERAKRDLPWRHTRDPYAIWISEVMLQQTRVATVIPYYERFLARFPSAAALASASEDEVLSHWAGLGYYSRARNLRRAARVIAAEHGGKFPAEQGAIRALPGVGEYTARAVGSMAFEHPLAVVDGNVERVLCRLLALTGDPRQPPLKREIAAHADLALDRRAPGRHNQALMELGATVCLPRAPKCDQCPLCDFCRARGMGNAEAFPAPRARRADEAQHWVALVAEDARGYRVTRAREDAELLRGQWGFPIARFAGGIAPSERSLVARARALAREHFGVTPARLRLGAAVRHSITYRRLLVHPVAAELKPTGSRGDGRRSARASTSPRERQPAESAVKILSADRISELPALYRKLIPSNK